MKISQLQIEVGENAIKHGWWDEERTFGELIALCHSELSEALEEFRRGKMPDETYYSSPINGKISREPNEWCYKPEGVPSELADVVIRIFDMCHHYGINIEEAILEKHEFNKTRPYKHGGKVI